ncbi:MAG: hypothetical protein AAF652_07435 [Cyanobacteria bacterium P01_C01_bin.72]
MAFIVPTELVNAKPQRCMSYAILSQEKEAVSILNDMYHIQSRIKIEEQKLDKLGVVANIQYDSDDSNSVQIHNTKVNEYNNIIKYRNQLTEQFNRSQDSYKLLLNEIYPSTNIMLLNCLNTELLSISTNTQSDVN